MLPEQQQRIMGYFIEEAKDHLNTIEQGLLNLQTTIEDPELVNEVFRAAHSVKGGAAMLGLTSIQQTAHRLEDSFKVLKECSVKVDQQLESLFLRIFDTLQGLLEQLSGPFGLTEELGEQMVRELEPVFEELNGHLGGLVGHEGYHADESSPQPVAQQVLAGMGVGALGSSRNFAESESVYVDARATEESVVQLVFDSDVPARMRELLQEFKQPEGSESRRQLRNICRKLTVAGEEFELPRWIELIQVVEKTIANPENTYRTLAPIIIRDIKQAQELVLSGRESSIAPSSKLLALLPTVLVAETDFEDLLAFAQPGKSGNKLGNLEDAAWDLAESGDSGDGLNNLLPNVSGLSIDELFDQLDSGDSNDYGYSAGRSPQFDDAAFAESDLEIGASGRSTRSGPEVGAAELNTLADLFDGESPDLDGAWEEEENLDYTQSSRMLVEGMLESDDDDNSGDFTDLLFDEDAVETSETKAGPPIDDLTNLFGEDLLFGAEPDGSAVAAGQEKAGLKQPLTRKQVKKANGKGGLEQRDGTVGKVKGQAEEDALGTLLDSVAAQTSAVVTDNGDLDDLFGDLDEAEAVDVPVRSSENSLNPDAWASKSNKPAAGGNDLGGAEKLAEAEIDDFEFLSEVGEDSDLSELLDISSSFLSSEGEGGEIEDDRYLAAGSTQNEEIGSVFTMPPNSDLSVSADVNWLEDAFNVEDESVPPANLELDDMDLDALFGDITSDSISGEEETVRDRQLAATSREAADLAELFGSVPTGTEYDGEASGKVNPDWLNLDGDAELPSAGGETDEGELASFFSDSSSAFSDQGLAKATVEFGALSGHPESEISSVESDDVAFDLLEDMFGEGLVLPADAVAAGDDGGAVDLPEGSGQLPDDLFDLGGAELAALFPEAETAGESSGEDDLFEALETDFYGGDLEPLSAESLDGMFEGDADLVSPMETGANLNSQELEGFDDLLDSIDAEVLVTSEQTTGFWDA